MVEENRLFMEMLIQVIPHTVVLNDTGLLSKAISCSCVVIRVIDVVLADTAIS